MSDNPVLNEVARESNMRLPVHFGDGNVMQRMFQLIFFRMAVIYSQTIPKHKRRCGEMIILLMALSSLSLLIYVHVVFNQRPLTCLTHLKDSWPRHGVIRVELFLKTPPGNYDLQRSYHREYRLQTLSEISIPLLKKSIEEISENEIDEKEKYSNKSINTSESLSNRSMTNVSNHDSIQSQKQLKTKKSALDLSKQSELTLNNDQSFDESENHEFLDDQNNNLLDLHWLGKLSSETRPILEYSLEYGILRLTPTTRQRLNIEVLYVKLDLSSDTCFGTGLLTRFLLDHLIGYEEILISSLKLIAEKEINKGYVRNVLNNNHYRFVSNSENSRLWTYSVAFFVMVLFTITISMLLRYSHFQIFVFIVSLLNNFEQNEPIRFPIPPLLTVILALIGMEALMSEFFNDATTGFYIILLVWMADQYNNICCHRPVSKHHWIRFFFLYHFTFYAYHARYNGQYSGLALSTSCFFILHSMLYVFHHVELPAIEAQMLTMMPTNDPPDSQSTTTQTTTVHDST